MHTFLFARPICKHSGRLGLPPIAKMCQLLGGDGGSDLVEGRIHNVVGIDLGSSFDESGEPFENIRIRAPAVSLRVRCLVPEANGGDSVLDRRKKSELVLESILLA